MNGIYKNIEEYSPNKKRNVLIVFDDIIAGWLLIKELNTRVTQLFIRRRN